jgi:PAS domain
MARSPDFIRLATSATRTLAETAFDSVREAVLVVDARARHLPVVLANAAARDCLAGRDALALAESSLYGCLGAVSASLIESLLAPLADPVTRPIAWRTARGESTAPTEIKLLRSPPSQRLVMLTFSPKVTGPDIATAADQLPLGLLILDRNLAVTYANPVAVRSSGVTGEILGRSALGLAPTSALSREVYRRALEGSGCLSRAAPNDTATSTCNRFGGSAVSKG